MFSKGRFAQPGTLDKRWPCMVGVAGGLRVNPAAELTPGSVAGPLALAGAISSLGWTGQGTRPLWARFLCRVGTVHGGPLGAAEAAEGGPPRAPFEMVAAAPAAELGGHQAAAALPAGPDPGGGERGRRAALRKQRESPPPGSVLPAELCGGRFHR